MDIEVISDDKFGNDAYRSLFEEIMTDIGMASHMERSTLVLKPDIPLFIFSVRLRTEPANKTISDVSNIRGEGETVHITITDERYAPDILKELWGKYGREGIDQQTRFDIEVKGADVKDISGIVVASGEETMKDIVGAIWRSMPEGIKVRHTYVDGNTITVVATEERLEPFMLEEGLKVHNKMRGKDV